MPLSDDDKADLVAYLDGELDDEATQALEARLSQDPVARAELESLKQVYGLLDYLPRPEPSQSFTHRTMERLSLADRPRETGKMPVPHRVAWARVAIWVGAMVLFGFAGWYSARWIWAEQKTFEPPLARPAPVDPETEWLARQPRTVREQAETLKGKEKEVVLAEIKERERKWKQEWAIAQRFWSDLQKGTPLPAQLNDFPDSVESYVREYLRHFLSKEEWTRLEQAQGQWPLYPMTLVELADKHPPALPGVNGPRRFEDLPPAVQKVFKAKLPAGKGVKAAEGTWPGFGRALSLVAEMRSLSFPNEFLVHSYKGLNPDMKEFVDRLIKDVLTDEEKHQLLNKTPNRWPDYPQAIQELARIHGLEPPWFVLPGKREDWDRYRLKAK